MKLERLDWTCVFVGEPWEAVTVQGKLAAYGVDAFVPDANMKTIDPFLLGAGGLTSQVLVPSPVAERAAGILSERDGREALDLELREDDAEPRAVDDPLVRLGRRVRWCGLLGSFPPFALFGLYLSMRYLVATRGRRVKPRGHAWTLAAVVLTLLWTFVAAYALRRTLAG